MSGYNTWDTPRSPRGLNHPAEVVPPRIGKSTQSLTYVSGEGIQGLYCIISAEGPVPYGDNSTHPRRPVTN